MNKTSFSFLVRNAVRQGVVAGTYLDGVGASFPMVDSTDRDWVNSAVHFLANDSAAVSVVLDNGWEVRRFASVELSGADVNRANKAFKRCGPSRTADLIFGNV